MRIREDYTILKIADADYVLPYGQSIADHRHGIRLNETGLFLIHALENDVEKSDLLARFAAYCEADSADYPNLERDLDAFLKQLEELDLLDMEPEKKDCEHFFQIGPLVVGLDGPKDFIPENFKSFACEKKQTDLALHITDILPRRRRVGKLLVRNQELMICEDAQGWFFLYPPSTNLIECHLSKDASQAWLYCKSPFGEKLKAQLFNAFRFLYLIKAQQQGFFALHSASILYRDRAWLFSGSSGTGKSTHTNLWHQEFQTPVLNGDLNLIGMEHGQAFVYGLPWCGTSGIYTTKTYPLGGITLLKKHPAEQILDLREDEKQLFVMQRLISPTWTEELLRKNLDFTKELCRHIPVFRLLCTREISAAHYMKHFIDETIN